MLRSLCGWLSLLSVMVGFVTTRPECVNGQTIGFDRVQSLQARNAPGAIPDRVVLTWSGDPATTQSVAWRTHPDVHQSIVQYTVAVDGPEADFRNDVCIIEGTSIVLPDSTERFHSVTMRERCTIHSKSSGPKTDQTVWSTTFRKSRNDDLRRRKPRLHRTSRSADSPTM